VYTPFQLAKKYLYYWFSASNGKGHGVHSPFVFEFITNVLNDKTQYGSYQKIEAIRKALLKNNTLIAVEDFGAGSRTKANVQRKVSSIAKNALKPKKFSQLLFRIAKYYQLQNLLELGTSLGITSSYLASSPSALHVDTLEGSASVAAIARDNFKQLQLQNIWLHPGNFDETLPPLLASLQKIDLAFIDGNHRQEPTLRYFQQLLPLCHNDTILIFDDVHWSQEMEAAWQAIKQNQQVTLSIDLFFIGLVFFRKENKVKQHFSIRF
jgi:predicted O-methyltransferase YrrM